MSPANSQMSSLVESTTRELARGGRLTVVETSGADRSHNTASRARDHGLAVGRLRTGALNAITDVAGIAVGNATIDDASAGIHSGVTAITHPHLMAGTPLPAGLFVGNGYGKFVGATQISELGKIETPVLLTSTLSTFRAADALVSWALSTLPGPPVTVNPVVGEVNDSWLSTSTPRAVAASHVDDALRTASTGPVGMGNVGGGTGACALGFKAGIGTSSRRVPRVPAGIIGVLVQANMGGNLRIGSRVVRPEDLGLNRAGPQSSNGSCVIVAAVDFPCAQQDLTRLARRLVYALARVGANFGHGSGDYGLAISTDPRPPTELLSPGDLDLLFEAGMDCVEEAVFDALLSATTVHSTDGRIAHELPPRAVRVE